MRLRDRLTIQRKTGDEGDYGFPADSWETVANRSCEIIPVDAKEQFSASEEFNEIRYRIKFRYEPNLIKTSYRLLDERLSPNRIFDVEGVLDKGNDHRFLICKCVERC